jgi:polyribonucleotide nucleotidyltransferase
MVVAGRVTVGDVAIMMVEAEATESTWNLIAGGATAPTEEIVAAGLEAAKPFIKAALRRAGRAGRRGRQADRRVPGVPGLPGRRPTPPSRPRWPPTQLSPAMSIADKPERNDRRRRDQGRSCSTAGEQFEGREKEIGAAFRSLTKKVVRQRILRDKVRIDGRGLADIRALSRRGRVDPAGARLGAVRAWRDPDPGRHHPQHAHDGAAARHLVARRPKRYMHNYNFPPYSTGETGRVGSPKRREIGHGALAGVR